METEPRCPGCGGRLVEQDRTTSLRPVGALLLLAANVAVDLHHHDDGTHADCPICLAAASLAATDIAAPTPGYSTPVTATLAPGNEIPGYNYSIVFLRPTRAPPAG